MKFIDLHCDTLDKLTHQNPDGFNSLRRNTFHVDLERLHSVDCAAQFFAIFLDTEKVSDPYAACLDMAALFHAELAKNSDIAAVNLTDGKVCCYLTVEDSGIFGGEIDKLHHLHSLGVRLVTLTWNHRNAVASPHSIPDQGLTPQGFALVEEMEHLGVLVDVSHLSDAGFWDVFNHAKKPFVASHSNARAIANRSRNLSDDMLKALGNAGGVAGLNYCGAFVKPYSGNMLSDFQPGDGKCTVDDLAMHAVHMINVAGEDTVALGSDFDGISDRPDGLDGIEKLPLVTDALRRAGITERQLDKIYYGNAMRIISEVF